MRVYAVDKPLFVTSHDVVAQARRLLGTRRVGHGGTLDPFATGVLALLVDEATKLSPFLTGSRKRYLAWVSFGAATATLDAEGPIIDRSDAASVDASRIEEALPAFLEIEQQVPPQFSAVKRAGVKGYQAARRGEELALPARAAGYHSIDLLAFAGDRDELPRRFAPVAGRWLPSEHGRPVPLPEPLGRFPTALLELEVRSGTYVRSFARDLGGALATVAFLSGLLRTRAGTLDLEAAVPPAELDSAGPLAPADALPYPRLTLPHAEAARVRRGQRLPIELSERSVLLSPEGELVAVAETAEGRMKLLRVWSGSQGEG